jgi:hypothetical protein
MRRAFLCPRIWPPLAAYSQSSLDGCLLDAAELQLSAERRLGEMLVKAKAAGQVAEGRPRKNAAKPEPFSRVTLLFPILARWLPARGAHARLGERRASSVDLFCRQ